MKFSGIPGLTANKKLLMEAARDNHLPHAQLFAGPDGALNLPMALALATYLHCENKQEEDACGQCAGCVKSLKYIHPDTHFVFPLSNVKGDKDEDRFKAEIMKSWRSFLLEQPFSTLDDWTNYYGGEDKQALISREESREIVKALALKPFESKFKIMIIWQPELMHPSAANGILKILEEPPPHTYFFLVTNAAENLLPTILSRTQLVSIPLLDDHEVALYLREKNSVDESRAKKIAHLADGNLPLAIHLIDSKEDDNTQRFVDWMRVCFKKNYGQMVMMAEEYHGLDKLSQRNMMAYSMNMIREVLLSVADASAVHRIEGEEQNFVQNFSKVMDVKKIDKAYTLLNDASYHLERNGSPKMIFLDLSLKLSEAMTP